MSENTGIEWTDATWNPVTGCTKVSEGCRHCYALTFAERWRGTKGHYFENGFDLILRPDMLEKPFSWKKPKKIFVNSMSDLFHKDVPFAYIDKVFAVMALTPRHTYQILTKRPERMKQYFDRFEVEKPSEIIGNAVYALFSSEEAEAAARNRMINSWPLSNVWLGTSVEDQKAADERIPLLLQSPAAIHFLSCEPLLGPVDLFAARGLEGGIIENEFSAHGNVDWVIVGGESGAGARPMKTEWAEDLMSQCDAAGVAYFFKQWGGVNKKITGRELNGKTYDAMPV